MLEKISRRLGSEQCAIVAALIESDAVLVPVPRSSINLDSAIWPGKEIANALHSSGYGEGVEDLVVRHTAIRSASRSKANRPTVSEHVATLEADGTNLLTSKKLVLVDDVVTKGATAIACAHVLRGAVPGANICLFAVFKTIGFLPDIEKLIDPTVGSITLYPSGKTFREP